MENLTDDLEKLALDFDEQLKKVASPSDLAMLKRDWLGKEGAIRGKLRDVGKLPVDQRPQVAVQINELKSKIEIALSELENKSAGRELSLRLSSEYQDLSLPGKVQGRGQLHPLTRVERKLISALRRFGLSVTFGPEIESEYFCFDSLNIPKHHPARDMQDTFFTSTGHVLRTHTTSVQARSLKEGGLPIKVLSPGRVYRNESADAWHTAMFHQFELIWLDKGLTLSHLMGLMSFVARELYGKKRKIRFKPKHYPYTEPSLGLDIAFDSHEGEQGRVNWVTVVGAGMIHQKVLKEFGYDPSKVSGLAFGFGTSRLAVERFGMPDMRSFYENDLRIFKELV